MIYVCFFGILSSRHDVYILCARKDSLLSAV
jgi:hypothetical protein